VISHRRVPLFRGRVVVVLRCAGAAGAHCAGTLSLAPTGLPRRAKAAQSGSASTFDVPAGTDGSTRIAVPAATRNQLKKRHKAIVRATATLADGTSTTRLLTVIARF
jgi:hypothetical protein